MTTDNNIDLIQLARHLLKKAWIGIICAVLAMALSVSYSVIFATPLYTSSATLYVMNRQSSGGISSQELLGYESLLNDYMQIIKSRAVLMAVIESGELDITAQALSSKISLSHRQDTRIINVSVTDADPIEAKRLVNLVCKETQDYISDMMKIEQIRIIDDGSLPVIPTSPDIKGDSIKAFAIGFIFCMLILAAKYIFDDKIISVEDIETRLGANVLGEIPMSLQLEKREKQGHIGNDNKKRKRGR